MPDSRLPLAQRTLFQQLLSAYLYQYLQGLIGFALRRLSMSLTSKERKVLKAKAHHLKPVVLIGQNGISDGVVRETDAALQAHELIKVQIQGEDRDQRLQGARNLAAELGADLVHHIGKIYILYRLRKDL